MTYFHTDSARTLSWLANVIREAEHNNQSIRLDVDSEGRLKVKRGESMWTAPILSTPDPYRDLSQTPEPDTDDGQVCDECNGTDGMHFLNCSVWAFN